MESLDESNFEMINRFFGFKFKDELDQLEMSNEISREFHAGKFDPISFAFKPKHKKRQVKKIF
jgi:hypothetical protein